MEANRLYKYDEESRAERIKNARLECEKVLNRPSLKLVRFEEEVSSKSERDTDRGHELVRESLREPKSESLRESKRESLRESKREPLWESKQESYKEAIREPLQEPISEIVLGPTPEPVQQKQKIIVPIEVWPDRSRPMESRADRVVTFNSKPDTKIAFDSRSDRTIRVDEKMEQALFDDKEDYESALYGDEDSDYLLDEPEYLDSLEYNDYEGVDGELDPESLYLSRQEKRKAYLKGLMTRFVIAGIIFGILVILSLMNVSQPFFKSKDIEKVITNNVSVEQFEESVSAFISENVIPIFGATE